jgi:hypothetical protein
MRKNTKRVPPALKHGLYSGIGLLPTESPAKFRKFKKQMFSELFITGPWEGQIGEQIVLLEWRRQHLSTYDLRDWAQARRNAIESELVPPVRYLHELSFSFEPHPENPSPEELKAAHRRADKRIQAELGAALDLIEVGEMATLGYLDKRLSILDRLDAIIARLYRKLAYVRAIKSMSLPSLPAPSPPSLPPPAPPILENPK